DRGGRAGRPQVGVGRVAGLPRGRSTRGSFGGPLRHRQRGVWRRCRSRRSDGLVGADGA
ncbi:unnamed protein product, partial [Prorocentrum cordatum]